MPPTNVNLANAVAAGIQSWLQDIGQVKPYSWVLAQVNSAIAAHPNANAGELVQFIRSTSSTGSGNGSGNGNGNGGGDSPGVPGDTPNPTNTGDSSGGGSSFDAVGATDAYLVQFQSMGIPLTAAARAFVASAVGGHWSSAEFLFRLRQTAFYKTAFAGIMNKDGTMKMSEAQYVATKNAFTDIANNLGFNLTDKMAGLAFKNDLSVNEFKTRYEAERLIRDNPVYFKQLRQTLKARGLDLPTHKDLAQFLMNEKPKEFYQVWREASARAAAVTAGIQISDHPAFAGEEALGRGAINRISKMGLSPNDLASGFKELADLLIESLPDSEAMMQGVTKKDFTKAVFGGKSSGRSRARVRNLLQSVDAFYNEQRAQTIMTSDGQGGTQQLGTEGLSGGPAVA